MGSEILTPDGAVLTDPGQVERALAEMWKQAGEAASGEANKPAASRVCVANLIVVAEAARWNELLEVLGELSPMYPTRTIAVLIENGSGARWSQDAGSRPPGRRAERGGDVTGQGQSPSHAREGTEATVRASVSALCHVLQPGQPQVCCEQIVLRASQASAADLHRTLLPLLESDVPVMVWWTLPPGACGELLASLARDARRFILDAGLVGVASLTELPYASVRDLGWYRIHRWRELIAGMFDECGAAPLQEIRELVVEVGRPLAEALEAAVWLIAFFGGQLGWEAQASEHDAGFTASGSDFQFVRGGRALPVRILPADGEGLVGVVIRSDGNTFEARRGQNELRIVVQEANVCRVPRIVHLPRRRRSEALAAALAGRAVDRAFARAAPLAAWLAGRLLARPLPLES